MSLHAAANAIRQLAKRVGPGETQHMRTIEQALLEIERRLAAIETALDAAGIARR